MSATADDTNIFNINCPLIYRKWLARCGEAGAWGELDESLEGRVKREEQLHLPFDQVPSTKY